MLKKNILVADSKGNTVNDIKPYLEKRSFRVFITNSCSNALSISDKVKPLLIILVCMPTDKLNEKICALLKEKYDIPIIIISEQAREDDALNGYSMGADDYIIKPISPRLLTAKIEALLRWTSGKYVSSVKEPLFNDGELLIDTLKHQIKKNGKEIKVTHSEYKVLLSLLKNSKAFTREELIDMVFGNNYKGSDRVIDTHIKNLRKKIETDPKSPRYILTVERVGYRFGI